ncbi:hypothetical protein SYNPS1DRAFT_30629 [Syncephalis pseudoplumigaleata]|uniref:Uncharacterized protein n=1 Tax=Syncephalis pseudoplumigaleata TaxID=1712513 RepID=A0A4P9YWE4_9FUNG|nr:hypothetical protein SYNPS1DRAFT_30629 [Syncephalis pseudoplumigaleata]|eukprot:RKP23611.1 hypothetical protein SYNPS1DRAFT_30629 [Syncephalis pseudoplumigaleata]
MAIDILIINCISILVSLVTCYLYFKRYRDSKGIHYAGLFVISAIALIIAIVAIATNRWIWPASMVLELARIFIVLHLIYLWLGAMHELPIQPSPILLQKGVMALFCIYIVADLVTAIVALRVLVVISLVAAILQAGLCAYLWFCARGAGVGLERKRTQIMRAGQLSAIFVLTSLFGLVGLGFIANVLFWIWVGITLFPEDALLYFGDKPAAFGASNTPGNGAPLHTVAVPPQAYTGQQAV